MKETEMTVPIDKCAGCRGNFYNGPRSANGKRCWSAEDGKMVDRFRTHRDVPPSSPGAFTRVRVPDCYHGSPWFYSETLPDFVNPKNVRKAQ